jgi:Tfp pilus assembly protein PilV
MKMTVGSGRRSRRRRGTTLVEVLVALGMVLVGMLAMFRVLGTSVSGSSTASRLSQAQTRAITILESIRHSPSLALACLAANPPSNWASCEQICWSALPTPRYDACIYTMSRFSIVKSPAGTTLGQTVDRSQQAYVLDTNSTTGSAVALGGVNNNVYDVQVVVGWNDDNTATLPPQHTVRLRTGVFPVQ